MEQIVDVPVAQLVEETEVAKLITQERVQRRTLEETVNVAVPQIQQPIVAVVKALLGRSRAGGCGEHEGRPRLDQEVLDAPGELRQPVVGVGGAQEEQGRALQVWLSSSPNTHCVNVPTYLCISDTHPHCDKVRLVHLILSVPVPSHFSLHMVKKLLKHRKSSHRYEGLPQTTPDSESIDSRKQH